jgi:hypothetical protein
MEGKVKLVAALVLASTLSFADDMYRTMVLSNVNAECAQSFIQNIDLRGVAISSVDYSPSTKSMRLSYAMGEKTDEAERQAIRDRFRDKMVASCGKGYDVFETIQKGEKLTTAADAVK